MRNLDLLRISLLASLTGCGTNLAEGEADGQTTTTMGSGTTSDEDTDEDTDEGTGTSTEETGEDPVCEFGCEDPIQLAEGIVQCPDGKLNRINGGTFDPTINAVSCGGTEAILYCTTDAQCGPLGKCIHGETYDDDGAAITLCSCAISCATDSDCSGGSVCLPPEVLNGTPTWPTCQPAGCTTGSDCGECGECGVGAYDDGCGWVHAIECRTESDLCSTGEECEFTGFSACFPLDGVWDCATPTCAVGRPLLVDAVACTAPLRRRVDWTAMLSGTSCLPKDAELAAYWAEVAAFEHASVASFARFGAQLLTLGAPALLLRECKQAALDEVEHARLAYGLASAYGGASVGPGQLSLQGVSTAASWREVVRGLIEEACVGETLGVAEALAAAEVVRVPVVRDVLERIAADELRHAQLAWRTLAWLLREADEVDRAWAKTLLDRAIQTASEVVGETHRPMDGVLGGRARAQLHRDARERVLAPLARAL